ncbi:hypothetical protein GGQ84_002483 [Desulfitispora alkaliphila]|uniref:hypothetical protein n=1 Tax=Desulfitispora alkaliphila TaxID=622674 RepID=UPI003D20892B
MRIKTFMTILLIITATLFISSCTNSNDGTVDFKQHPEAIAIVNGDLIITMDEVQVILELFKHPNSQDISLEEAVRIKARKKLLLQEAKRRNISIPEQEQKELVATQKKELKGNVEDILPIILKAHGVTEEEYWEKVFYHEKIKAEILMRLGNSLIQEAIDRGELPPNPQDGGHEYFKTYGNKLVDTADIKLNQQILEKESKY